MWPHSYCREGVGWPHIAGRELVGLVVTARWWMSWLSMRFLLIPSGRDIRISCYNLAMMELGALHLVFTGGCQVYPVFSVLFGWCEPLWSEWFLSCRINFSLVLCDRKTFYWGLFCLCLLVFLGYEFFQFQVWDIWRKRKTQGTHHHVIAWILRFLGNLPSLYLWESSYVSFI